MRGADGLSKGRGGSVIQAAWRRRLAAPRIFFPEWARDRPERLIYASTESGKREFHAWDRRRGTRRQITDRAEGTLVARIGPPGDAVWWFDDGAGSEFGMWRVQPFEGGPAAPAAPSLPPHYPAGLALGTRLAVVGTAGPEGFGASLIRPHAQPVRLYAHSEEAWVAELSRDEWLVAMTHSEHGDSRHPAARVIDQEGRAVADLWDGPGLAVTPEEWSPRAGDQRLIVHHERQGVTRPAIWDPVAGRVEELELPGLEGEVTAGWYPNARALLLTQEHRGRSRLHRYDLASGTAVPLTDGGGSVDAARVRPDGEVWESWSDGASPPRIRQGQTPVLEPAGEPAPPGVAYGDFGAAGIPAFLVEPVGRRPYPTVFLVHGGPEAHDRDSFSPRVQAWADHGFAVVLVNYRGSTGYGREWRDALEGNPGLTEVEDVTLVRDQLVARGIADADRIVLAGRSWGGYITLLGAGVRPDRWSVAIADVPVADYEAAFEDEMEPLKAFDRALFRGAPSDRPDFYRERSPITYAGRVRAPVMILGGRNDPRCPIRQITNYVGRMAEVGRPVEFYAFQAGHASLVLEEQVRQVEAQIRFAARHLGTPDPL